MTDESVLKKNERIGGAGQSRAVGLFLLKRYQEAADAYDELLALDPGNIVFWTNRVICLLHFVQPDTVFFDDMLARVNHLPAEGYLCLADVLSDFGRFEDALVFAGKTLEKDPDNVDACLLKADLLDVLGRDEELKEFMRSIFPRLKKDDRILCLAASYAAMFWNVRQSEYLLCKALKKNSFSVLLNERFYTCLLARAEEEKVIKFATQALDLNSEKACVWGALAKANFVLEKYEDADKAYEKLSSLIPLSDEMKIKWAQTLSALKRYVSAFDLLNGIPSDTEDLFLQQREILVLMREESTTKDFLEKIEAWHKKHPDDPRVEHVCAALLKKEKTSAAPLEYVRLINDAYADILAASVSDTRKYCGTEVLEKVLHAVKEPLGRSLTVLDAGCGTGGVAQILTDYSRPSGTLTGVDISSVVLDFAEDKELYDILENEELVTFCKENEQTFDLIAAIDVLPYFADLTEVFKAVETALKPGGLFVFTVLTDPEGMSCPYALQTSGQFFHNAEYTAHCLTEGGLSEKYREKMVLRQTDKQDKTFCVAFAAQKKT